MLSETTCPDTIGKSRRAEEKLITFWIFLFSMLFSYSIIAQHIGALRSGQQVYYPKKIMKPAGDPLPAGTYSVGASGYFSSIGTAFNKLGADGIAGPVTLELIDSLYTATTSGFVLNGPISGANRDNRVTIQPAANKNVIIQGYGNKVLSFLNTSFLTIDGLSNNKSASLTIKALFNYVYNMNSAVKFVNNSNHNIIQNITAISENKKSGYGIAFIIEDRQSLYAPDSNLIQNNFVKKAGVGIYISGYMYNVGPVKKAAGNIIRGNLIGSETDSQITWGIQVENSKNTIIENNTVMNISYNSDDILGGALGINSYFTMESIIRNNLVHSIFDSCSEGGAIGISLSGQAGEMGSNNLIYNNMIYDIHSSSKTSPSMTAGIHMWYQTNTQIHFNSVYLNGQGSNPHGSAALYIEKNCSNVDAKNNILVNKRDEKINYASSIYDYTTSNLTSDYNDLYYGSYPYSCLVNIGGTKYKALTDWQAKNKDLNSITEMPNFKEGSLYIDESMPTNLESHGTPIAEISVDYNGEARDPNSPDIGADEFDGNVVGVENEDMQPLSFALGQNYPNPFNPATTIKYSIPKRSYVILKVYDILGREIETLINEEMHAGNYEIEFNAVNLPSAVYLYKIKAGHFVEVKKMILLK